MTLYESILLNQKCLESIALIYDESSYMYSDVIKEVDNRSKVLTEHGIVKNSKVIIIVDNPFDFTLNLFAVSRLNAVAIPLYDKIGKNKISTIIEKYKINFVIRSVGEVTKVCDIVDSSLEDIALILFTSGTTSVPKAIMLSTNNITSNVNSITAYLKPTPCDNILLVKNLSHSSTIIGELFVGLKNGCTIVLFDKLAIPSRILSILSKEKISIFFAVPTLLQEIIKTKKMQKMDLSALRIINFYGASMSINNILKLIEYFPNSNIIYSYGLTEASPRVTYIEKSDLLKHQGSSGKAIKDVKIKIDSNSGEILVQGPNVMKGYYKDFEKTNSVLSEGWLHTGDLGKIDSDGFLYVIGRKDNMFVSGGKNIYPEEIEGVLTSYENILEALCISRKKDNETSDIIAYIVLKEGTVFNYMDLISFCKNNLELYKLPKEIIVVEKLEKTSSGKVRRR